MVSNPAILTAEAVSGASAPTGAVRKTAWGAILLLALIVLSGAAIRTLFAPIQEAAKLDLHLSDFQLSMVQGIASAVPIAIVAIPLGWLADHSSRMRILIGLSLLWTVGTFATAFVTDFNMLFLARMLAGLGGTLVVPVAISVAADMSLPDARGRSMLFLAIGNVGGAAVAFAVGGALFGAFSDHLSLPFLNMSAWREVNIVFGVFSLLLILPLMILKEPKRHEVEQAGAAIGATLRALWARKAFLGPLFVGQIGVTMADASAAIWAAPVLARDFHQQPAQFAGWMGGVILLAGIFGAVLGGFAADFGQKSGRRGGILIGAVIASAIGIPVALFPIMHGVPAFAILLLILLLVGTIGGTITATSIAVLIPNEERGLCLGAFMILGSLVGLGISPIVVTMFSQAFGGENHIGMGLAITGVATGILSFLGFLIAMFTAPPQPVSAGAPARVVH
jgi:MFS family permease